MILPRPAFSFNTLTMPLDCPIHTDILPSIYIYSYIHITILIPLYMTSRLSTIFSAAVFSSPFSLSLLYISFIYVLTSPLLMSLFPSVLALPFASFFPPFHSLPFTLSSRVLFSSPFSCLIYFLPHSSLGSFRGSVGRAIGC